ncbi:hypothetical protein [Anaerocolumna chitinilytica]|uniref:Uncharacterized protein n=1 Tax=Anaerocolumna chitinilytica TaxID=1727145 RepID=A0A7I8DHH5_9FIRM|nr:hypothetical protein [Anaerocolumna chitinilytica]BCJ97782.1 hypothetical protein bsdcttw_08230 [Anaerocolumna chitinilytica]
MNEQTLINMLSELDAAALNENFTERDFRNKKGNIFKRAYFYVRSIYKKEENLSDSILMDHWEEFSKDFDEKNEDINQTKDDNSSEFDFSIRVFKRGISNIFKLISAVIAALVVIIGLLLVIIKRRKFIKRALKKMQISY